MTDPGSMKRAFDALRAEVETAQAPSDLFARIAHRAEERTGGTPDRRRIALAASAAVMVLLGALTFWWRSQPVELAGFQVATASPDFRSQVSGGLLFVESGQARLHLKGLGARVSLAGSARLRREQEGVRLVQGTATFEVEPRKEAPFGVYVSGGRIEVIGTRFTVVQGDGAGEVSLADGSIRFVDLQGQETVLHPGQRLQWPPVPANEALPPFSPRPETAPPPAPAPTPRIPRLPSRTQDRSLPAGLAPALSPGPPQPQPEEVAAQQRKVLAEIDGLRIRREDDRLVRRLDEILAEGIPEPMRERLSFERCDVLAHKAGEERRACDEIERHLTMYPGSEYAFRLQQSRHSLGCKP